MDNLIAVCGLDCAVCECRIATLSGNQEDKERIAKVWGERYDAPLTADDISCTGCRENGALFGWCNRCPIRACAIAKGYETCADCSEMPCQTNQFLFDAVPSAKENLENLRSR